MCPYLPKQLFIPLQAGWGSPAPRRGPSPELSKKPLPSQTKTLSAATELVTKWKWSLCLLLARDPYSGSLSGNHDYCVVLEKKRKKKSPPNWNLPLAGMCVGADGGKNNSFEHNMHQCVQICFMAEVGFFLIVNMSCSFVPPTQKCVLLGIRFYSWPS